MRALLGLALLLAACLLADEMMLNGQFRQSLWLDAQSQGHYVFQKAQGLFKKATL
jgi:hypothetical protein